MSAVEFKLVEDVGETIYKVENEDFITVLDYMTAMIKFYESIGYRTPIKVEFGDSVIRWDCDNGMSID